MTEHSETGKRPFPWKMIVKIVFSLAVLAVVFHFTGIEKTIGRLSQANLWYVPVGVGIYLTSQYVSAYRWQFLSAALEFRLALRELYDYYLIGMFFNLFLPGSIGGDAGRMVMLANRCKRKKREALLTLLAERGVGLVALMFFSTLLALTPVASPVPVPIRMTLVAMSAAGVIGFIGLQLLPVARWAEKLPQLAIVVQARVYWADWLLLLKSVGLSLVVHGCMVGIHVMIAHALGVSVSVWYLALVYGIVSLVSVLPVSFNGLGVREGAYQFLLVKAGLLPETALAFALYWFLISTLTCLCGGIVLAKGHYKTPRIEETASEADPA